MKEAILHIAIENFQKTTGLNICLEEDRPLDGVIRMDLPKRKLRFTIECKNELRGHQLHQLQELHAKYNSFMLVANRIFPREKEELRTMGIPYLEANGNVFIKDEHTFIFIDTRKNFIQTKEKGNRAFTKTGLKVLLHLLQNKEDINLPQRELAKITNVGLGTIPQVIEGLKDTGYLLQVKGKQYIWEKRRDLLDRWITEYDTVLKPKLKKERYHYNGAWENLAFNNELTVWGGEPAADILTNYLRPEKFIIYTKENRLSLMKNYRLLPKKDGEIEVLELFWQQNKNREIAPEILVYAELLLEGGKRNKETAERIFNEYIEPRL
ncbi:type IV toxin-antitoxin system AbiEi family antitoxin [Carboxylicivirga sp. RSCT41]|uniref:type IV toxin-antitoxin system AbiEi family antitoxin n=1 Tax=Carboxylicivirga agarovorans TaxID=3417570 RepID=UPI003D34B573